MALSDHFHLVMLLTEVNVQNSSVGVSRPLMVNNSLLNVQFFKDDVHALIKSVMLKNLPALDAWLQIMLA